MIRSTLKQTLKANRLVLRRAQSLSLKPAGSLFPVGKVLVAMLFGAMAYEGYRRTCDTVPVIVAEVKEDTAKKLQDMGDKAFAKAGTVASLAAAFATENSEDLESARKLVSETASQAKDKYNEIEAKIEDVLGIDIQEKANEAKEYLASKSAEAKEKFDHAKEKADQARESASQNADGLGEKASEKVGEAKSKANNAGKAAVNGAEDVKSNASDKVSQAKDTVSDAKENASDIAEGVKQKVKDKAVEAKKNVEAKSTGAKDEIMTKAQDKAADTKEKIAGKATEAKDQALEKAGDVKENVADKATKVKDDAKHKASATATAAKDKAADKAAELKDKSSATVGEVKQKAQQAKEAVTEESSPEEEEEGHQSAAYNPETGEINWDCPCLGGMANGSCGEEFKAAFSCFVYSEEEPKGIECISKFLAMRDCFREHPEEYKEELSDDHEDLPSEQADSEASPAQQ